MLVADRQVPGRGWSSDARRRDRAFGWRRCILMRHKGAVPGAQGSWLGLLWACARGPMNTRGEHVGIEAVPRSARTWLNERGHEEEPSKEARAAKCNPAPRSGAFFGWMVLFVPAFPLGSIAAGDVPLGGAVGGGAHSLGGPARFPGPEDVAPGAAHAAGALRLMMKKAWAGTMG